jgi:O-antigen/teichoic acid export membrane protein
VLSRAPAFRALKNLPRTRRVGRTLREAVGIGGLSATSQITALIDVALIAGMIGTSASGVYRLAVLAPTQAIGIFFQGVDVVMPRLAYMKDDAERASLIGRVVLCATLIGAGGLTTLALLATQVIQVLAGRRLDGTNILVALLCLTWSLNIPAHVLAIASLATHRQARVARVSVVEAGIKIVLSILLVSRLGIVGAAIASLFTVGISNLVAVPMVLRRAAWMPPLRNLLARTSVGLTVGALAAAGVHASLAMIVLPALPRLAAEGICTIGFLSCACLWVDRRSRPTGDYDA